MDDLGLTPRQKAIPSALLGAVILCLAFWDWRIRYTCNAQTGDICAYLTRLADAWLGAGQVWQLWALGEGLLGLACFTFAWWQLRKARA
ncbi:hypothetical protein [Chitinolyticbacter albus]|uniref:hypothetical protein n=1 Tax=Chitinolyticbacter albus TaxID=2961951 RepID=UPI00210A83B9|nr:hypothetical protein [Chitinolyticbacter albus]